ncbi:WD40-repeat-containing domain protein [Gigaspora rosea]|uniref:WD40-repeat-containing domain protein n=1 Tax=Gigaspora rosea TaxID=44941 RepID=A0A397WD36_9GLOM|nr:WD40-repeat-containing domain protein [Gigaspora rosea]
MLPTAFGSQKKKTASSDIFSKTRRKDEHEEIKLSTSDQIAKSKRIKYAHEDNETSHVDRVDEQSEETDYDDDDDENEEDNEFDTLPISHEIKLNDHYKSVSALTLDPAGARLITGSYDYDVKFWDFAGMDSTFRPFRTIKPCGDHQIHHLEYSLSGDQFLIISGTAQAKLYDRDGFEIEEYIKGDPYIRDMRNTNGHIASLTCGGWHPNDRQTFFTGSADSTIRIWDVENKRKQKHVLVHKSKERGGRSAITAACYSLDSKFLAGAAQDGCLFLWGANGPYTRPSHMIEKAHQPHSETSSIIFSRNNWSMVTRGGDDCVKVWDVRNFKSAVAQAKELPSFNAETNVIFSPDERMIITGTATKKGEGYGKLVMMDRESLEIVRTMSITKSSVIRVLWHSRINQIVTGSADGLVHVFYDPAISVRGAKLCVVKEPKRRAIDDYEINRPIIAPHSLSMFRDDRPKSTKRKREKLRKDPVASRRPDLPVNGPGKGGKIGSSLTQHIMKELIKDTTRDEDPREALLKFAEISKSDPQWIGNAYQETQPKPILADTTGEDEEEDQK